MRVVPIFLLALMVYSTTIRSAELTSSYRQLAEDKQVGPGETVVLQADASLTTAGWLYLQSDGRYMPSGGGAIASTHIFVDGVPVGNSSMIDWSSSRNGVQHSFNNIAATFLQPGHHSIELHASSQNALPFTIGAGSNLSVLVGPASFVSTGALGLDSNVVSPNVAGLGSTSTLPLIAHVNLPVDGVLGLPLVAMSSARLFRWGESGDPLVTISVDGEALPNDRASWSDNDMWEFAETQAPFFTQAFIPSLVGLHNLSLVSTALPYSAPGADSVQYRLGGDSTLVTLAGMSISGAASAPSDAHNVTNYVCVASSQAIAGCPATGSDTVIAEGDIVVPSGHNGIVLVSAKTRIQADIADPGGHGFIYITIDGVRRGSLGAQQLAAPSAVSTRTLAASYLATGTEALSPGTHHVELHASTNGTFAHLVMTRDLPLIWFD